MKRYLIAFLLIFANAALLEAKPLEALPEAIATAKKVKKPIFVYVFDDT